MPITIYPQDAEDFTTNGLGTLCPVSCTVEGEDGHFTELEVTVPIDDTYRWAQLERGAIIKAPVPLRESPEYEDAEVVVPGAGTAVMRDIYIVTAKAAKLLRSASARAKSVMTVKKDRELVKLGESGSFTKCATVNGGRTGWIRTALIQYDHTTSETVSGQQTNGAVLRLEQTGWQLFRIYRVEPDTAKGTVTARAMHIIYDLMGNIIDAEYNVKDAEAASAIQGAFDRLMCESDIEPHIGAGLTARIDGDYSYKNPIEALFDPENGMAPKAGAITVFDNWDLWILPGSVRDSGVTIRRGKNLKGVKAPEDVSDVVTRIIPRGKTRDGGWLYITDGTGPDGKCVDSLNLSQYPYPRIKLTDYDVSVVDRDADNVTTFTTLAAARARLRELAEKDFDDGCDLAEYGLTVDFILLQDSDDDEGYAGLQSVYMGDTVTVIDSLIGIRVRVPVTGMRFDCLKGQYVSVKLGDVDSLTQRVYSYQLPSGGISGSKIAPGTADGSILRNMSIQYAKIGTAAIERLSTDAITALTAVINSITSQTITTNSLAAAFANLINVAAQDIEADRMDVDQLAAAYANIISVRAATGLFDQAQIADLISQVLTLEEGYAGSMYITNLAITSANLLNATMGKLVLKGTDGNYYEISIGADGVIATAQVAISAEEIAAGQTSDGRQITQDMVNAQSINGQTVKAQEAVLGSLLASTLNAGQITANDALLASASIPMLYTTSISALGRSLDLSANSTIQLLLGVAGNINEWFTFSQNGLVTRKQGSKWSTRTDADGFYIDHDDVAGHVGAFHQELLEVRGLLIGDILARATSKGGWVWTDE